MPSVVLSSSQIDAITYHFCQAQIVTPNVTAIVNTADIRSGISTLAMSVSIGGGTISYSPAFQPPLSNMTTAQQSALICYMLQTAMGVPLFG